MDKKKAILCVDDEAIILHALVHELKSSFGDEFIYEKATDAISAFDIIDDLSKEGVKLILIISDWLMPGIRGDEFLETVAKTHPDVKAIMITGQADEDAMKKVRGNSAVHAVLRKPWNSEELRSIVRFCCTGDRHE